MLFPRREQLQTNYTGTAALGGSIQFQITRQFFLDSLLLIVPVQVGGTITSALTYNTAGLANIVKRVQLNVADGTSNRMQTDCSGYGLIRRAARVLSGLDTGSYGTNSSSNPYRTYQSLGPILNAVETGTSGASAGYYNLTFPLLFKHPQLSDPVGSITMLPLPRYNTNPTLTVNFGALSDVITTNHGATLTIGTPYVVQIMRQVNNITFPTIETELRELSQSISTTGINQIFNLDIPGSYTALDIYTQNSSSVGADISGGFWQLQFLGQMIRQFNLFDVKTQEQYSQGNDSYFSNGLNFVDNFPGFYHLDFIHDQFGMEAAELGSLLNVNVLAGSGAQLQLAMNIGSTGTVNVVAERFFGDLSGYGMTYNPSGN